MLVFWPFSVSAGEIWVNELQEEERERKISSHTYLGHKIQRRVKFFC